MVEKTASLTIDTQLVEKEKMPQKEKPSKYGRDNHITSCRKRLASIALMHGIDSKIHNIESINLTQRVTLRHQEQLERQQANLEEIIALSHEICDDKTASSPDLDWLFHFFDMAKNIHGEGMQNLWARILKQEIMKPGSTSLKALSLLKTMTHREAQTLQRACALVSTFGQEGSNKLITGFRQPESGIKRYFKPDITEHLSLGHYKLPFIDLLLLMDLGLILRTQLESGPLNISSPLSLRGQDKNWMLTSFRNDSRLCYYRFSPTGNELSKLVGTQNHPEYFDALIALLSRAFEINTEGATPMNEKNQTEDKI